MDELVKKFTKIDLNNKNESIIIIQKYIRRYLLVKKLSKNQDNMTLEKVNLYLDNYIKTYFLIRELNKDLFKKKIRNQNFPSEISENIVKFVLFKKYKIMPSWDTHNGDLTILNKKIEVKGFMSSGPSSFGPNENWDFIYFIDATNFVDCIFIVYEIKLSNKSKGWMSIKMNKNQTYNDQCNQGRRPHITFNLIEKQLKQYCKKIFNGKLLDLY